MGLVLSVLWEGGLSVLTSKNGFEWDLALALKKYLSRDEVFQSFEH